MKTIIALFDAPYPAQRVLDALRSLGLGEWEVMVVPPPPDNGDAPASTLDAVGSREVDLGAMVRLLRDAGVPPAEAQAYAQGVRRGAILIAVRAPELTVPLVRRAMEAAAPPDLATHLSRWATRPDLAYGGWQVGAPKLDPTSSP